MVTNHIPRLLRLARRTGDRLIVTDEQGGGEPMVILPLDEYEMLIDQAFGPGEEKGVGGGVLGVVRKDGERDEERQGVERWEGQREEEATEGVGVTIELDDVAVIEGITPIEGFDDEAEIDEAALIDLWREPTAAREEAQKAEMQEKMIEVEQKKPVRAGGGEEQFYLEPID